jgi:hypothetical protein
MNRFDEVPAHIQLELTRLISTIAACRGTLDHGKIIDEVRLTASEIHRNCQETLARRDGDE